MGNSQPTNRTGKKATAQKLENAKKLGILSLTEHKLSDIPAAVFEMSSKLKTLDISNNELKTLNTKVGQLGQLKTLNLDGNHLSATTLDPVSNLSQLQKLSVAQNKLGLMPQATKKVKAKAAPPPAALPIGLPSTLRDVSIAQNELTGIPPPIFSLVRLEKLDLSMNHLTGCLDEKIGSLVNLVELLLDGNSLVSLPESIGQLKKLKVLSLRQNMIRGKGNPQPLPSSLFSETPLIDLNLHGNPMTNTELNEFDGFGEFLSRRKKVKNKTLTNLTVCGLD